MRRHSRQLKHAQYITHYCTSTSVIVNWFADAPRAVCLCGGVQYLYTLKVTDSDKAEKLTQSLPPGLQRKDI